MKVRSTFLVALVVFVVIQSTLVDSWWWRRRRRRNCSHPKTPGNSASYSAYYYGSTSLWGGKKGKRAIVRNTWTLRHSLLQFRGKIFEWGLGKSKTYSMTRALGDCKIRWSWGRKGESRCLLSDAENWTRRYRSNYGSYKLLSNNCHHFVNRLGSYLASNCGR